MAYTSTTDPAKVRAAKSAAYATAKKHGFTIDYRPTGNSFTADAIAPHGKHANGQITWVTHYYTKPDAEFWDLVRKDIEEVHSHLEDIDYDKYPELDDRDEVEAEETNNPA